MQEDSWKNWDCRLRYDEMVRRWRRLWLYLLLEGVFIGLCSIPSLAKDGDYRKVGVTSATFLKIGIGARATSMGEAFCAVADDTNAIYWNPAGLGFLKEKEVSFMYNIWFEDIKHGFLGYTHPFKNFTFGGAINYLDVGRMKETTWEYPEGTGETFRANDFVGYLTYTRRLKENLSLGVNLKYIRQRIEDETATGFGVDLGILYKPSKLRLGLVIQNIGTELKFIEKGFLLPLNIKAGVAYPYKNFLFALDANKSIDNKISFSFGIESLWWKILALRFGYKLGEDNRLSDHTGIATCWSAGIGVNLKEVQFDATYILMVI